MRLIRAAVAAAVLGLVTAGLPLALVRLGHWPITGLPSAEQWRNLPSTALTDTAVFGALTVAAWIVWLLFTASVVVELTAEFTGRAPRTVPLAGPLQLGARQLVAAIVMTVAITGPFARHATAIPLQPRAATSAPAATTVTQPTRATATVATPVSSTPPTAVTVAAGDNPWDLAERHLGDGMRWRELYDLNRGTPQPDGRAWTVPDQIDAGWILELPPNSQPNGNGAASTYVVEPGDTLSAIAETELGDANRYPEIAAATAPIEQSDGRHLTDPNLIRPGWEVIVPGDEPPAADVPETEPAAPPSAPPPPATATTEPSTAIPVPPVTVAASPTPTTAAPTATDEPVVHHPRGVNVTAALGGAFLTALLAWRLDRLRRSQQRRRRPGHRPPRPSAELSALEAQARAVGAHEAASWLDATLRALTATTEGKPPSIALARAGDLGVELVLQTPDIEPPRGFVLGGDGVTWRVDPALSLAELEHLGAGHEPATTTLVTLGSTPEGAVLVDVAAAGVISIQGDPGRVDAFFAGVIVDLACAPWAQGTNVVVDSSVNATPPGVSSTTTAELQRALDEPDTVMVVAEPSAALTVTRARTDAGAPIVAAGPIPDTTWSLVIDHDGIAVVEPFGLVLRAAGIDEDTARAYADLLTVATNDVHLAAAPAPEPDSDAPPPSSPRDDLKGGSDDATEPVASPVVDEHGAPLLFDPGPARRSANGLHAAGAHDLDAVGTAGVAERMTPEDALDPDVEAWVRVLGPVDTIGWAETARPRQIELVAYLATQSAAAVSADRLNAALWPNGIDPAGQRAAASRARKALGQSEATGDERFPRAVPENPTYRLHATVSSDWALAQRHLAAASAADSADGETDHLIHALALVRGEPFSGVPKDTYGWAHTEHVIYEIEVALTDAAHRLGELALAAGDWATARWAARQGLRVSPWQEAMFRLEMRARAGAGDIDGVHRAWRATVDAARIEDPESTPQPETCALYDQLIHQSRTAAGA